VSPIAVLQRPFRGLRAISRYRATISGGPNFAYELCIKKVSDAQKSTLDLSSWSMAFSGAEPVRSSTLDRFAEAFAPCGFRREAFYPCYGLAEATLAVSGGKRAEPPRVRRVERAALERGEVRDAGAPGQALELVGCGAAIPELEIRIVDPQTRVALPEGRVGEVWVKARSLGRGYWRKPVETEATFHARIEPAREGPFLRTGDLGFLEDGELYVTGRMKDVIVIRGRNLYPQDIEQVVDACHPAIRRGSGAAVPIAAEDEEGVAVVQEVYEERCDDWAPVIQAIRKAVADDFGVQVQAVLLLRPGLVPKTSSGKIQRHACEQAVRSGSLPAVAEWRLVSRRAAA
jgi:acyl-CoA synthetase (AMP-forming)/AMP-acid ligase II